MHMRQSARSVRQRKAYGSLMTNGCRRASRATLFHLKLILGFRSAPPQALCRRRASRAQGKLSLQPPSVNYQSFDKLSSTTSPIGNV